MKTAHTLLQRIGNLGLILLMGASMTACSSDHKWKEEVQLSDGRVVVVERAMISESGGGEWASNRSGTKPKEYLIRFEYPEGKGEMIEWRSIKKSPMTWPEIPLVLDMDSKQPVVFAVVAISNACEVYSKYVYRNGVWVEEVLSETFQPHLTNLLFGSQRDLPSLLNLEGKRKRNSGAGYRQSLKNVGPNLKVCGL